MSYKEKNKIEVKNPEKKCAFRYLDDDEIDSIIINRIHSTSRRGGKGEWTEEEIMLRNSVVLDYLGKGVSRNETRKILMRRWDVSDASARRYIKDALEELVADYDEFSEYTREQHLQRLEEILEDAMAHSDRKSALSALDQMGKINGLFVDRKDVRVSGDEPISFEFS